MPVVDDQPGRAGPGLARPVIAGSAVAAAGAAAWAGAAYAVRGQCGFLAVLLGACVGAAVTRAGSGPLRRLQAAGALVTVPGCALGSLAARAAVLAAGHGGGPGTVFGHLGTVLRGCPGAAGWTGLLFWAAAIAVAAWYPACGLAGTAGGWPRRRARPARRPGQTAAWQVMPGAGPGNGAGRTLPGD